MENWSLEYLLCINHFLSKVKELKVLDLEETSRGVHVAVELVLPVKTIALETYLSKRDSRLIGIGANLKRLTERRALASTLTESAMGLSSFQSLEHKDNLVAMRLAEIVLEAKDSISLQITKEDAARYEVSYLSPVGRIYEAGVDISDLDDLKTIYNKLTLAQLVLQGYTFKEVKGESLYIFKSSEGREYTTSLKGYATCDCGEFKKYTGCRHTRAAKAYGLHKQECLSAKVAMLADPGRILVLS